MRKSSPSTRARMATAAGLTTGAVVAALLVNPTAAFAAATVTPTVAAANTVVTITEDGTPFTAGVGAAGSRVQLLTTAGATCAATIQTVSTTILTATITTSTTSSVPFTLPTGATAGTNGQAKRYTACVYGTGSGTPDNARQGSASGYPVLVGTAPTIAPALGTTGGGNLVTVTAGLGGPIFTGVTSIGAVFSTTTCPATVGTPATGTSATVTKVSDSVATLNVPNGVVSTAANPTTYFLCLYNGATSAGTLISAVTYLASQLALSQTTGPYQGGNGLNITSPNQFLAGIDDPGVVFMAAACDTKYEESSTANTIAPVATANVRKLANNRLAATVPTLLSSAPVSATTWNVCIYNGAVDESSDLIASNPYSITTVQASTGITPKAGPALGGSRIVVTGTAFPTTPGAITATLGGAPLTDITPINATAFEATTPQHAPANNVALVVTTAAGQHILTNAYSFTSALTVTPNTAPNTRAVDVIVNGVGFQSGNWNTGNLLTGSHIFLVDGVYNSSETVPATSTLRANPPVADCANILVLSDNEVICNLNLAKRLNAAGTAVLAPPTPIAAANTASIGTTVGSRIVIGAASTFTEESIGMVLNEPTNANIPPGTTIVDVLSDTTAIISANATGALDPIIVNILPPIAKSFTATTTVTNTTFTASAATFTSADVGRYVVHAGVPIGTTIASVTSPTVAVLSTSVGVTASGPGAASLHSPYLPVPEGAYNLQYVSNAALNAVGSDPSYVQSMVSSVSTFTVSSF
jgi:hypothetical protein